MEQDESRVFPEQVVSAEEAKAIDAVLPYTQELQADEADLELVRPGEAGYEQVAAGLARFKIADIVLRLPAGYMYSNAQMLEHYERMLKAIKAYPGILVYKGMLTELRGPS